MLTGPSGVGKDAVVRIMREHSQSLHVTVTATTRLKRPAESAGVDYIFVTKDEFQDMIDRHDLLEWAEVYGNLYGVPKSQITEAMAQDKDVLVKADVQGAATIRSIAPDVVFIFLAPPNISELEYRLSLRMTESKEALALRLKTAESEMIEADKFDHVVVNPRDRLSKTVRAIEAIIAEEHVKRPEGTVSLTPAT